MKESNRIGVLGIEKLIEVERPFGTVVLLPVIDVFLDFPPEEGVNDHAFQEAVHSIINGALGEKITAIEDFGADVVRRLVQRYKTGRAEVRMRADYVVYRKTPVSRQKTQEMYKLLARAVSEDGKIRKMIGAEVMGIASCPCAQEGLIEYTKKKLKGFSEEELERILKTVPVASHDQRNVSQLLLEVPEEYDLEAEELIEILEGSMSSMLYEVLKREDEMDVVLKSHANPNFVEDIVRKILVEVVRRYKELPGESMVFVRSESFESIHQHNALAERISSLEELRKEIAPR
jgi:GTP cyclohydrolase-4